MRKIWFALLIGTTFAISLPAAAQTSAKPAAATPPAAQAASKPTDPLAVTRQDRILGKPDAPITIVEYASFTCPHCAHFAMDVLPQLKKKWIDSGKAKLVMRPFPRDAEDLKAATLLLCVPPDKFYPLAETLFQTQDKWVEAKDWEAQIQRMALLGGVSKKEFSGCVGDKSIQDNLLQSRLVATNNLTVEATPTFFLNGKKFDGDPTVEALDQALSGLAAKS